MLSAGFAGGEIIKERSTPFIKMREAAIVHIPERNTSQLGKLITADFKDIFLYSRLSMVDNNLQIFGSL